MIISELIIMCFQLPLSPGQQVNSAITNTAPWLKVTLHQHYTIEELSLRQKIVVMAVMMNHW